MVQMDFIAANHVRSELKPEVVLAMIVDSERCK